MFSSYEIIDIAIQLEENGVRQYQKFLEKCQLPNLSSILNWLIDEELKHKNWFTNLKSDVLPVEIDKGLLELSQTLSNEFVKDKTFSLGDINFDDVDNIKKALDIFIEFEKDTIIFYETLAGFIEDSETQEAIEKIIQEEKEHIKKLKSNILQIES